MGETLYQLVADDHEIKSLLMDPEIDPEVIEGTLECIKASLEVKAESYCKIIRELEANQKALQEEADFYAKKASTIKNNIKRMKDALCWALVETGNEKGLEAGNFTLKAVGNGGKQPLIIDGEVPDNYTKVVYEKDTEKIRLALEAGEELSFAHLEPRGKHLTIK